MPYVSIQTDLPVAAEKAEVLQQGIGRLITIIPGKTIDNCMTQISGGRQMYLGGGPAKAVFCEVRLFGAAPAGSKAEFGNKLDALLRDELGAGKTYINFLEFSEWCSDGNYSTR